MRVKRSPLASSNQHGFTLIELVLVIGIMAVLSTIAIGEFYDNRKKAYDRQALSITRNLLNNTATLFANDEIPPVDESLSVGTSPAGYPDVQMNPGIYARLDYDGANDSYHFFVASVAGSTLYYFWLPGPSCTDSQDVDNYASDVIIDILDPTTPPATNAIADFFAYLTL